MPAKLLPLTDAERLDLVSELIAGAPDVCIFYETDDGTEDDLGMVPAGWNIRIPEGCYTPAAMLNSETFRGVIDALAQWKKDEEPSAGFRP